MRDALRVAEWVKTKDIRNEKKTSKLGGDLD